MGYQESFIQFKNVEVLKSELKKYKDRDSSEDAASIYGVTRVRKDIHPFKEGNLVAVVGGERYAQRSRDRFKEELGLKNIKHIVFIDNPDYCEMSDGNLGGLLDEYFEQLTSEEHEELLG